MENLDVFINEDNKIMVNEERPPPRMCPRCNSDNTKFCYYNNYSASQPRYFCKNCRRYWTHGGSLRNIPIGGSCRKPKRAKQDQPSQVSSQVVSLDNHHHEPLLHFQESNEFIGFFVGGGSSSGYVVVNHFAHNAMMPPIRSYQNFSDGSFQQNYFNVGYNDLIDNRLINRSIGGDVDDYNGFHINNQEDQNMWNQSINNTMNMKHNASTSGTRGYPGAGAEMNIITNSCVFRSSYHLEKHVLES